MNKSKSKFRNRVLSSILIFLTLSSFLFNPNHSILQDFDDILEDENENNIENQLHYAANLDEPIYGDGQNQTVRVYMINSSNSLNNNGSFLTAAPNNNSKLPYGEFNFTFEQNYNTTYELEDDLAYDYSEASYNFVDNGTLKLNNGTSNGNSGFSNITDNDILTFWNVSFENNIINFTLTLNFSKYIDVKYNYTHICRFDIDLRANFTGNVNLTVQAWDHLENRWKNVSSDIFINASNPSDEFVNIDFKNENLRYLNKSGISIIQFFYKNLTTVYEMNLYEFDASVSRAFELPITNESYVALEFDLKGNATVNGFLVWIRALNLTEAVSSKLMFYLYRANETAVRNKDGSRYGFMHDSREHVFPMEPNTDDLIDSFNISGYVNDSVVHFSFNRSKTKLNVSNYFIVIKSNITTDTFRLMTLPSVDDPDISLTSLTIEHLLLKTNDNGISWTKYHPGGGNEQCDASPIIINVTRGWMPDDINITLDEITLSTVEINTYPYNGSSPYKWGLGKWVGNFSIPLNASSEANFNVSLNWNSSVTSSLYFNVSYRIKAYSIENATAHFNCTYDLAPQWILNYTFNTERTYFTNWKFLELWYLYPYYWSASDIIVPNGQSKFDSAASSTLFDNKFYRKYIVPNGTVINTTSTDVNGTYSLKLTSYNCIYNMTSYLNFKRENYWLTNGFMLGDNVSVKLNVEDHNNRFVSGGIANCSIFLPNGTKLSQWDLYDTQGFASTGLEYRTYNFSMTNIINTTPSDVKGAYTLGFFWQNGTAIGCKKKTIYIDEYDFSIENCEYDKELGQNIFEGNIIKGATDLDNFTALVATVNETTGTNTLGEYFINNTISESFTYTSGNNELTAEINQFLQNESIFNPSEKISIKIKVQNKNKFLDFNVSLSIQLISLANSEWIIAELNSSSRNINLTGSPNDSHEFSFLIDFPDFNPDGTWYGINSPIRLSGCKTKVKVYIEDEYVGSWTNDNYSVIVNDNDTLFEGKIISYKYLEDLTTRGGLPLAFERDEFIIPGTTSFFVNLLDRYWVSAANQINKSYYFKLDNDFESLEVSRQQIIYGQTFNLTTYLISEKNEPLSNKRIYYYFLDSNNIWNPITGANGETYNDTDANGKTIMEIASTQFQKSSSILVKLNWSGTAQELSAEINYTLSLFVYSNQIEISSATNQSEFYRNKFNSISIIVENTGNSILTDINISIGTEYSYSISKINYYDLDYLEPGENTEISYKIFIPNVVDTNLTITVNISATSYQSNEEIKMDYILNYDLIDESPFVLILQSGLIFMFVGIACLWLLAFFYRYRINKKVEKVFEKVTERKAKGKYVKVSELKGKTPKAPKKREASLDELIEEEKL